MNDYFTDPRGYNARHRNHSEQARVDGIREDYVAAHRQPCRHYRPRHSAFAPKVRAA